MTYMVITKVDKANQLYNLVTIRDDIFDVVGINTGVPASQIVNAASVSGMIPLNFSVDRNGNIVDDCGSFTRFAESNSAVVLAELKTKRGKTLGYRLLSCSTNQVVNLKTDEIVAKANSQSHPFLQNGIVRGNSVACYPLKKFPVLEIQTNKSVKAQNLASTESSRTSMKAPKQTTQYRRPEAKDFNKAQSTELQRCKAKGIDTRIIANPDLSDKQMRVLWVSKSKGALAEYYNDPRLSVDAMKFYGDRIVDVSIAKDCELMLQHPELSVDQLSELYQCVCDGVDYKNLIGMSASNIQVEREKQTREYWGSTKMFDPDYFDKAMNVAMHIKGM